MFTLRAYRETGTLELQLKETHLRNIKITNGTAHNVIIATPLEVFNLPGDVLWALNSDNTTPKHSITAFGDAADLEDIEDLVTIVNEALARNCSRPGAAKAVLSKLKAFLKTNKTSHAADKKEEQ